MLILLSSYNEHLTQPVQSAVNHLNYRSPLLLPASSPYKQTQLLFLQTEKKPSSSLKSKQTWVLRKVLLSFHRNGNLGTRFMVSCSTGCASWPNTETSSPQHPLKLQNYTHCSGTLMLTSQMLQLKRRANADL